MPRGKLKWLLILLFVLIAVAAIFAFFPHSHDHHGYIKDGKYYPAARTKTANCVIKAAMPDPGCTPGAIDYSVTIETICTQNTNERRKTSRTIGRETFRSYATSNEVCIRDSGDKDKKGCENDHLVSIELGGADNDIANHFPQPYEDEELLEDMTEKYARGEVTKEQLLPYMGAHAKDKVENWFHQRVCKTWRHLERADEKLQLPEAQMGLAEDWTHHYFEWATRNKSRRQPR